uniref:Selenoprotein F n=1 Tax=Saccharum spontaneum TaxID=62335 RepID=A0A678T8T2_SACSP|nr:hypothetical protein SS27B03_000002 [Saccharum spontaneum]
MDRSLPVAAVVAVVLVCCSALCRGERLGARECEDLGFTGLALCSDCNALSEFVKDQELVEDCRKCCTEDSDDSISKLTFSGAIIEVCMRKLVFYPEVVGFLEEDKDDFPYVEARYSYGSPPKLIMLDNKGEQKETIRQVLLNSRINLQIDNWKREHIRQFLKEKVKPVKLDS